MNKFFSIPFLMVISLFFAEQDCLVRQPLPTFATTFQKAACVVSVFVCGKCCIAQALYSQAGNIASGISHCASCVTEVGYNAAMTPPGMGILGGCGTLLCIECCGPKK